MRRAATAGSLVVSLVAALALALSPVVSRADDIMREAALHALLQKVELPLARQVFARAMATMGQYAPRAFVDGYGRTEQLGADWKAGNPQWEHARALVAARLAREESTGNRVFGVTRLDVERALDVPWSEDDIRFLDESLATPLGQTLERLLDAGITAGFIETLTYDGSEPAETRAALDDALAKARAQYQEAVASADRISADDPQRADRLRRLLVTADPAAIQRVGAGLFRPSVRRFSSLMVDITPELDVLVAEFRARR